VIWNSGVGRVNSFIAPSFKLVGLNNCGFTLSTIRVWLTIQLKKSSVLGFDFLLKSMVFLTLGLRFGFKRLVFLLKMLIVKLEFLESLMVLLKLLSRLFLLRIVLGVTLVESTVLEVLLPRLVVGISRDFMMVLDIKTNIHISVNSGLYGSLSEVLTRYSLFSLVMVL
jgi:hypothetical protein